MSSRAEEIRKMSRQSALKGNLEANSPPESESEPAPIAVGGRINCPVCDEDISARAKKCRHCGETLDVSMRIAQEAQRASERGGTIYLNGGPAQRQGGSRTKSKVVAFALAWILGGFGGHKFYLDRVGQGILYLLFFWTFIPAIIAFIEGIVYITMDDERFWEKYG